MAHAIHLNAYAGYEAPGVFARLLQSIADVRKAREIYDELEAMSDRDLADLGLSRLNLRDVARAAVTGR